MDIMDIMGVADTMAIGAIRGKGFIMGRKPKAIQVGRFALSGCWCFNGSLPMYTAAYGSEPNG